MKYAILDDARKIINIIEVEPELAPDFNAHYLGGSPLGIGDQYPETELTPDAQPTELQSIGQQITDEQLDRIEMGQAFTDLELTILGGIQNV